MIPVATDSLETVQKENDLHVDKNLRHQVEKVTRNHVVGDPTLASGPHSGNGIIDGTGDAEAGRDILIESCQFTEPLIGGVFQQALCGVHVVS